jgi:putative lipase involved disintegration of autophagic bodies
VWLNPIISDLPLSNDWLEWAILGLALVVFFFALRTWIGVRRSNKRFVKSQVDEKIATIYQFAYNFEYIASENARRVTAKEEGRVAISRFQLLSLETNIVSVGTIAKNIRMEDRTRLLEAMVALQGEMDRAGYTDDGKRLRALLDTKLIS